MNGVLRKSHKYQKTRGFSVTFLLMTVKGQGGNRVYLN